MFRKLYLLFAIRSVSKSLRTFHGEEGKELLQMHYEELLETDYLNDDDLYRDEHIPTNQVPENTEIHKIE